MKKIVFTIQIFVLIALFPVYLVVELNHNTGKLPVHVPSSEFRESKAENKIQPALNTTGKDLSFPIPEMDVTN